MGTLYLISPVLAFYIFLKSQRYYKHRTAESEAWGIDLLPTLICISQHWPFLTHPSHYFPEYPSVCVCLMCPVIRLRPWGSARNLTELGCCPQCLLLGGWCWSVSELVTLVCHLVEVASVRCLHVKLPFHLCNYQVSSGSAFIRLCVNISLLLNLPQEL